MIFGCAKQIGTNVLNLTVREKTKIARYGVKLIHSVNGGWVLTCLVRVIS